MSTKPSMRRQSFVERYILARATLHHAGLFTNDVVTEANEIFDAIDADTCKRRDAITSNVKAHGISVDAAREMWSKPNPHMINELSASIDTILDRTCMRLFKTNNTPENTGLRPALVLAKALVDAQQRR